MRGPGHFGQGRVLSYPPRRFRAMGITRHAVRVHLSTRTAGPDDHITVPGMPLWVVDYTMVERGRESTYTVGHAAEAGARRMVRNLLRDRMPGLTEAEVYTEDVG
ncbi:hypothetical protein B9M80_12760 [Mycobacteroides abscessus]|nr:hypothetical protein B9M80_12760 [Mycobacteroides abscessus]